MNTDTRASNDTITEAAAALLEVNRYAKQDPYSRSEIYQLKNEFLEWLFERGYCTGWNLHTLIKPEKNLVCFGCDGTGEGYGPSFADDDDDDFSDEEDICDLDGEEEDNDEEGDGAMNCYRCGGTGVYRTLPELRLEFVAFRFEVEGRRYTWHQPLEIVSWDFSSTPKYEDAGDWGANDDATLSSYETLAEVETAMAVIRRVITPVGGEEAAQ